MANLEVSYSSTVANPTRQQLDELDTLLQQMLGLPVHPTIDAADPDETTSRVDTSLSPEEPRSVADPEPDQRPQSADPFRTIEPADAPPARAAPVVEEPQLEPEVLAALENLETQLSQKLQTPAHGAGDQVKASRGGPPKPFGWLLPLVWCNRLFDWGTIPLGPLGRWLRGAAGRSLLGWAGLALLATALVWCLFDLLRWIW